MKYKKEERLEIGRKTYHELTKREAMTIYHLSESTIDRCVFEYRDKNKLPARSTSYNPLLLRAAMMAKESDSEFAAMNQEELIEEIIKIKIQTIRIKVEHMTREELLTVIAKAKITESMEQRLHKRKKKSGISNQNC